MSPVAARSRFDCTGLGILWHQLQMQVVRPLDCQGRTQLFYAADVQLRTCSLVQGLQGSETRQVIEPATMHACIFRARRPYWQLVILVHCQYAARPCGCSNGLLRLCLRRWQAGTKARLQSILSSSVFKPRGCAQRAALSWQLRCPPGMASARHDAVLAKLR